MKFMMIMKRPTIHIKARSIALLFVGLMATVAGCSKGGSKAPDPPTPTPPSYSFKALRVNGLFNGFDYLNTNFKPAVLFTFSTKIKQGAVASAITWKSKSGTVVPFTTTMQHGDSSLLLKPNSSLEPLTQYALSVATSLKSQENGNLQSAINITLNTHIDSTDKFPLITDDALLTLVQQKTFKYFYDYAHPVSGLARERTKSGDIVTSGGSGFGIMALITGIHRNFISRADGLARLQKIVGFLKTAETFKGAFPHWLNGATGKVVPFSAKDNGADLVETSYLMQGLLTARQYFNGGNTDETNLRNDINTLWNAVDWSWFRKNNENVLYWHWSSNYGWDMNLPVRGWNECLITYVLAASSTTHGIPKAVYDNGWANNGAMRNNNTYYNLPLPLGPAVGGPLFFAHYSFLGINPESLTDAYANYWNQNKNHTLINRAYCNANPQGFYGYSDQCWGLTASDIQNGYTASSPTNDVSVIAPTAALSSFPYTPTESMQALKFFYYKLGDKLWGEYGFKDAFSLHNGWFADSYLAIDQGPIIVMIENYRSKLLWNLFMSCPEVRTGMKDLGFQSPNL